MCEHQYRGGAARENGRLRPLDLGRMGMRGLLTCFFGAGGVRFRGLARGGFGWVRACFTTCPPQRFRGSKTVRGLRVWCLWECWCYCIPRCHGRVAEWQTRWLQVPVSFGTWGFKSPFADHERFYELQGRRLRTRKGFVTSGFFVSEGVLVVGRRVLGLTNSSPANCRATHLAVAASEQSTRHNGADRCTSGGSGPHVRV